MFDSHRLWFASKILLSASVLLLAPALSMCQEAKDAAPSNDSSSQSDMTNVVRTLTETVRALQAQVQSLQSQVNELSAKDQGKQTAAPASTPKQETVASSQTAISATGTANPYSVFPAAEQNAAGAQDANTALTSAPVNQTVEQRVANLEDDQQLIDAKLDDQYQTKIESGSKYRVRLSGMILVGLYENRGTVDNQDFPELATEGSPFESNSAFGGSLRQTQMKLEVFGPQIWGAHTSANVDFDFAGGFPTAPNGAIMGIPRFRTGKIHLDWANTSIVAGQDYLFFSPLQPTSLATVAIPPLSYSGNLWAWTPQIRIEHRIAFSETSHLLLQAGILDSLSGDPPDTQPDRYPSWGEQSGQPAYAGRIAWSSRIFGQDVTVGEGAYYGRQYWGLNHDINGWAATSDATLPLGPLFTFTGSFYRGSGLGGLGGGIGQDIVLSGPFTSASTVFYGVESMGGWAQLKFKPTANFEINGAFGQDNPFGSQLRMYEETTPPIYGDDLLARNRSTFVNFIYHPKSNIMMSVEYLHIHTFALDESYSADHINLGLGYIF